MKHHILKEHAHDCVNLKYPHNTPGWHWICKPEHMIFQHRYIFNIITYNPCLYKEKELAYSLFDECRRKYDNCYSIVKLTNQDLDKILFHKFLKIKCTEILYCENSMYDDFLYMKDLYLYEAISIDYKEEYYNTVDYIKNSFELTKQEILLKKLEDLYFSNRNVKDYYQYAKVISINDILTKKIMNYEN
jgi:hypothetical protein